MGPRKMQRGAGQPDLRPLPPDQEQREAIVSRLDTTMLVEASAGAGKTRSMVDRMVGLVREDKCRVDTLAAITFTRKAAAELRSRFQVALESAARQAQGPARDRLAHAVEHVERVFIGTIHSFCGRLLRERPVEAGVEPSFLELDETVDAQIRSDAWNQYVAERIVAGDPLLDELDALGLPIGALEEAFLLYATFPDVDDWPAQQVTLPDLGPARAALLAYAADIETLLPTLPEDPGNDKLMPKLEMMARRTRQADLDQPAELMEVLAAFADSGATKPVQKNWPGGKAQALAEEQRWQDFVARIATPLVATWRQLRYPIVLRVLNGAVATYDRLRREAGGLNYQDLLLLAARLLRDKPQIRRYFRRRFTHVLVDEFQDTDPVQAEVMLLLTAADPAQTEWRRTRPVPGALFVVGDPKQSIYRFRRADIVTYNEVRKIIEQHGEVVVLRANFRSRKAVIDWVNTTFDQVFPAAADFYSPARAPMVCADAHDAQAVTQAVEVLQVPGQYLTNDAVVQYEAEVIAQTIKAAMSAPGGATAQPGDFLIISTRKRNLSHYANRLHELGIPCEVTGGAVLNEVPELALLCLCLEALAEPDNPVSLVAVLRSELFGMRDDTLYEFHRAGGRFAFHTPVPDGISPETADLFADAFGRLRRYDSWLRRLPPVAAIERIAADLGLFARAAVVAGGNVRAGSMARAIELLRSAVSTLFSLGEMIEYLRELVGGQEPHDGLPAAAPVQSPVRIMNLHQAKGLEASYVFLADPTGATDHEPILHVDRGRDGVRGYLCVGVSRGERGRDLLAHPAGWERFADEERKFQDAERHRLMYVAATRAGSRMIVTQRDKKNHQNPWQPLEEHLVTCPHLAPAAAAAPLPAADRTMADDACAAATAAIVDRWNQVTRPSYAVSAVKTLSVTPVRLAPAAGDHGTEWGSVIHVLLENAMRSPAANLQHLAEASLADQDLDPARAAEAVATVQAVMRSEIWQRAQNSAQKLTEVPFRTLQVSSLPTSNSMPIILRGVIDLVFRESAGWIVVDYKTDARVDSELPLLVEHYRPQVEAYSHFWQSAAGEPVFERGLYFTHTGKYVRLE